MTAIEFSSFTGLDLRKHPAATPANALRRANNVNLKIAGGLACREPLTFLCNVSSYSVGLYVAYGSLRAVVPGGNAITDTRPPEVVYDVIGDGTIYAPSALAKLHAVELVGSPNQVGTIPYIAVELANGKIEHHYCTANPPDSVTAVNTKVNLPFDPGHVLIKSHSKIFADDPANGLLRFSSTLNGPTDWISARDAGALAIKQYITGQRDLTGVGYYRGKVAVQFKDATQIWSFDADPANFQLETVMNGPGTDMPLANANMLGDLIYFSRGEFRQLSPKPYTSEIQELNVGSYIGALTSSIVPGTRMIGLWSQVRQQYVCAVGSTVYCYTNSPVNSVRGWTTWTLPVSVDNMVEMDGTIFIRSGTGIYKLDTGSTLELGNTPVQYDVISSFLTLKKPAAIKKWRWIDIIQAGTSTLTFHVDPNSEATAVSRMVGIQTVGATMLDGHIGINLVANCVAVHFTGSGPWALDSFIIDVAQMSDLG